MADPSVDQNMRGPGVPIPPPLIYLAFFLVGIALGWMFPLPFFESWSGQFVGGVIAFASLLIAGLGFKELRAARTTFRPDRPASSLVTAGVFNFSRNPLYVSLFLLYAGVSFVLQAWWAIILTPLLLAAMNRYVVAREERYLERRFGAQYSDYCKRVRRWL